MDTIFDAVLNPRFQLVKCKRYRTIDIVPGKRAEQRVDIFVDLNCLYSSIILINTIQRRPWCNIASKLLDESLVQFSDFENIEWEYVMSGKHRASSYLVRKGLSRKAQLALQIKRFLSKHPKSTLADAFPHTVIVETWNAFEDIKLDFGPGVIASFGDSNLMQLPLRQRLDMTLDDLKYEFELDGREGWHWILKPSVTNKGLNIHVVNSWERVLDVLEDAEDTREWVCQKYISRPLLISKHKFHLRVYVVCVGALRVYVFNRILMLLAARRYDLDDIDDPFRHLTNTARGVEEQDFDEEKFVKVLDDLPAILVSERRDIAPNLTAARDIVAGLRKSVCAITCDLFRAYENEYTVFAPMDNCFEMFGLDFMVDEALGVHLLEVNPGPDFKQTGDRLRSVIVGLFEQMCTIVVDEPVVGPNSASSGPDYMFSQQSCNGGEQPNREALHADTFIANQAPDMTLVYRKMWSVARMKGGMSFIS